MSQSMTKKLAEAAFAGDLETTRECLDAGASVDGVHDGRSPLHWAIENENEEVIRLLVSRGANVEWAVGCPPPLMAAVDTVLDGTWQEDHSMGNESTTIVTLLLEAGADVNTVVGGPQPQAALDVALSYGSEKLSTLLREWGARAAKELTAGKKTPFSR